MALIELHNVTFQHELSDECALIDVQLSIERGEFVGVIGRNGSGKTTLVNTIRGFVPKFYTGKMKGDVFYDGENLKDKGLGDLALDIGYIFQNPFNQISYIKDTVFEEIAYGLENMGILREEIIQRTEAMINRLDISHLKDKNPFELSGGQQQRVALASVLVMEPQVLVIDEPTSQLDPQGTKDVFSVIEWIKRAGKTVVLVEHKIDLLAEYADRIIVLHEGRVVLDGPTDQVVADPSLIEYGIEPPSYIRIGQALAERSSLSSLPASRAEVVQLLREKERCNYESD